MTPTIEVLPAPFCDDDAECVVVYFSFDWETMTEGDLPSGSVLMVI